MPDSAISLLLNNLRMRKSLGIAFSGVKRETLARIFDPKPRAEPKPEPALRALPPIVERSPITIREEPAIESVPTHQAANILSKAERLAALKAEALECVKCGHLAASRLNVVFGVGNPEAQLMFVGEAPGAVEDREAEPFVGPAGQLLTKIIEAIGMRREEVYIANVLKCRPDMPEGTSGNRAPRPDEMATCLPYLLKQIEIIQPKVIIALGGTAMAGLFPGFERITRARGHWHEFQGIPVMPTFHPSFLLQRAAEKQTQDNKRLVWEDMLVAKQRLGIPLTAKESKALANRG